jgi:hypothetical protein
MFAVESTVAALRIALRINRAFYQLEDSPVEGGGDFNTLSRWSHAEFATTRLLPLRELGMDPGFRRDDGTIANGALSCGARSQ